VCIAAFVAMMMSEFSAYYNNPEMKDILESIPKAMLEAFAMGNANLTTVSGFVSIASVYFYIMLGIFAALLGSSIISKEERDKTVEFFLTMPISREKVIVSKWIAAAILCIIINCVTILSVFGTTAQYDKVVDFNQFMGLMMLAIFIIQMIFLNIGMLLAAIMKRYKKSGTYSMSILLGLYILSIFVSLSDKIEFLKYVTPFKYFEANYILREGQLEGVYIFISLAITIVSFAGTIIVYPKRDLHI
jgi:ABC-2 type transport system permease protein